MSEKSNTFVTSLKIISVLLVICIVCGALLALCNDLFYIDDETKFNRAMQKVYPKFDRDTSFSETPVASHKTLAGVGEVKKVYRSKDGAYVLETKGFGGFSSGTVTMYIVVGGQTPNVEIKSLSITANEGQSWVAKVEQKAIDKAYVGKKLQEIAETQFSKDKFAFGGATGTSTAVFNAVKATVNYCVEALKLVSTPESEARDAALALLGGYTLSTVVNDSYTTALGASFYFTGTKADADDIDVYVFGDKASGHQIVALKAGLKHADRTQETAIVAKSEGIDNALVSAVQGLSLIEHQVQKSLAGFTYDADGTLGDLATNVDYANTEITKVYMSNSGAMAIVAQSVGFGNKPLVIMVVIAEGKVAGWELVDAGSNNLFERYLTTDKKFHVGASIFTPIVFNKDDASMNITNVTMSGNALCNIINLAAHYARSIMQ